MKNARTFVALPLPAGLVKPCVKLIDQLHGSGMDARWSEAEDLHITLAFLGELTPSAIVACCRAAARVASTVGSFGISLEGLGVFPSLDRPRVLWAGLRKGQLESAGLNKALLEAMQAEPLLRPEDRGFHPHVTLGRLNAAPETGIQALLDAQTEWNTPLGWVENCLVMEARTGGKPRYATMATCPLLPGDDPKKKSKKKY